MVIAQGYGGRSMENLLLLGLAVMVAIGLRAAG